MPRKLSSIAPDWWDYTTLDEEIIATGGGPPAVIGVRTFVEQRTPRVLMQLP